MRQLAEEERCRKAQHCPTLLQAGSADPTKMKTHSLETAKNNNQKANYVSAAVQVKETLN